MPANELTPPPPVPAVPDLRSLLDSHARLQAGCYISGCDDAPDGGRWLWSRHIAEFGLNMGVDVRDEPWLRAQAERRGRAPVALAADMAQARDLCRTLNAAPIAAMAWLWRTLPPDAAEVGDTADIAVSPAPAPDEDFLTVMARQSPNPAVNAATMEGYGPALREATAPPGLRVRHLTLRRDGEPVACASIYAEDGRAGLYNIAVAAPHQRRGLGRRITERAIGEAAGLGCTGLLLQCVPGGHVERLYGALGFARVARPLLLALR